MKKEKKNWGEKCKYFFAVRVKNVNIFSPRKFFFFFIIFIFIFCILNVRPAHNHADTHTMHSTTTESLKDMHALTAHLSPTSFLLCLLDVLSEHDNLDNACSVMEMN